MFRQPRPFVAITAMRMNHVYSGYNNWSRLIVLGVVPFALLVFFNARIYSGISQRSGRRRRHRQQQASSVANANAALEQRIAAAEDSTQPSSSADR